LVTVKRPMFAYESEVRIVGTRDDRVLVGLPERSQGFPLPWNPEEHLEAIYVHPEADGAFMEAVASATAHYTPSLTDRVVWSQMRDRPPV
jgi:hypothetical protein